MQGLFQGRNVVYSSPANSSRSMFAQKRKVGQLLFGYLLINITIQLNLGSEVNEVTAVKDLPCLHWVLSIRPPSKRRIRSKQHGSSESSRG